MKFKKITSDLYETQVENLRGETKAAHVIKTRDKQWPWMAVAKGWNGSNCCHKGKTRKQAANRLAHDFWL